MENLFILVKVSLWAYLLLFFVMIIHELIHLMFIKLFKKEIKSIRINPFGGKVSYINDHKYVDILIISIAPNVLFPLLGGLLLYNNLGGIYNLFAIFCLIHLVNFLPFTADGRVVLYCLLKIVES